MSMPEQSVDSQTAGSTILSVLYHQSNPSFTIQNFQDFCSRSLLNITRLAETQHCTTLNCLLHKQSLTRVFLFLQEKQVFKTSNGFHAHPYISKYHHTNFQTSIHSDAPSAAQTVNRRPV